jgi:multiple sugar transport system ATP-binding protein
MAGVRYVGASRVYAKNVTPAVDALDLDIKDGEFMVLVGPSGSGKTTALRMLAGLEPLDGGRIEIAGRDISDVQPKDRDIAMVFQNYALYPSKTVAENMGFALKMQHVPRPERDRRVREAARILDLDEGLLERKPKALSGGQRQRVAMGRAIVREPKVFLMDEPLSNLDAKLRVQTRSQIAELQRRLGITTVYVTHDQVEAMTMGHRVAVLSGGKLQQCASPRELYDNPVNQFVAGFIGSPAMNLLTAPLTEAGVSLAGASIPLPPGIRAAAARDKLTELVIGIRPEHLHLIDATGNGTGADAGGRAASGSPTDAVLPAEVLLVEELGADALLHVRLAESSGPVVGNTGAGNSGAGNSADDGSVAADPVIRGSSAGGGNVVARTEGRKSPAPGSRIAFRVRPEDVFAFNPVTGARLAG